MVNKVLALLGLWGQPKISPRFSDSVGSSQVAKEVSSGVWLAFFAALNMVFVRLKALGHRAFSRSNMISVKAVNCFDLTQLSELYQEV